MSEVTHRPVTSRWVSVGETGQSEPLCATCQHEPIEHNIYEPGGVYGECIADWMHAAAPTCTCQRYVLPDEDAA